MKQGIIIGAGIGGLTTAIALLKKGIDANIYEQAPEIKEVGAGIWIAPNGMKVFAELGIAEEILKAGNTLETISITDLNDKPISVINGNKVQEKHKFGTTAIHRATLQKILASQLPSDRIILNKKFKSYHQTDDNVTVYFEDGTQATADFVICADGIKSNGRLQIQSNLNLRYSGQTCWRFVTDFNLPNDEENKMYEVWSNKKGLRVGYSKINEKQVYVYITNFEKQGGKDNANSIKNELMKLCSEFPSVVKQIIQSVDEKAIIRTDLFDFKPIRRWVDGKVTLMGDAAHATTPNLGQGACQAIEDANIIAEQLSSNDSVEVGFKHFEAKRIKKASYITNTSWQFAQLTNTTGLLKYLLIWILRITPASVNERQLDKIYSLDY